MAKRRFPGFRASLCLTAILNGSIVGAQEIGPGLRIAPVPMNPPSESGETAQSQPLRPSPPTKGIALLGRPSGAEEESDARIPTPTVRIDFDAELSAPRKKPSEAQETVIQIKTTPPSAEEVFRLETETEFRARLVREIERGTDKLQIPQFDVPKTVPMQARRNWPERTEFVEPSRLAFGRLFFEQNASERHGRSLGFIQSFVAAGTFYADVACFPVSLATNPFAQRDEHRDLTGSPRYSTSGMIWSK